MIIEPFTRESIGTYQCFAFNLETGKQVFRRINLNGDSKPKSIHKPLFDVSERIEITSISDSKDFVRGGTVRLKCFIGIMNIVFKILNELFQVIWLIR